MLDYYEIIFGTILTVLSSMILGYFLGALGSYSGFIIVTAYIGYRVNKDLINGALHGSIVAILAGMLSFIVMMVMWSFGVGPGSTIMEFGIMGIIFGLLINLIVGASGGAIGSAVRS